MLWVFLIGLVLAIAFTVLKVKGGLLLAIAITTVVGIPFGVTSMADSVSISDTFSQLPQTFGAIFSAEGFPALFSDPAKFPLVLVTIFAFSMSDTFDTIGTFIGTGRRTGIFSEEDEQSLESGHGFSSKMTRPCSPTRSPPPSARSAAPQTPPPTSSPPPASARAAAPV